MTSSVAWGSYNTSIATVGATGSPSPGMVTAVAPGSTSLFFESMPIQLVNIACGDPPMCESPDTVTIDLPVDVASLFCTGAVRGGVAICTGAGPSGLTLSNWQFTDGTTLVSSASGTTRTTWAGTVVTSGIVTATAQMSDKGTIPLSAPLVMLPRNWHTMAANPQEVANGTFIQLPVPPSSNGSDSGLGYSSATETFGGSSAPTIISDFGPNNGYVYLATQPTINTSYRYEINPDLENVASTFFAKQTGTFSESKPQGSIAGSTLLFQTRRHEYNHPIQSQYGEWVSAISVNNAGDGLESLVQSPGHTQNNFNDAAQQLYQGDFNHWDSSLGVEPFAVNQDAFGNFLGNICYPNYSGCQ